MELIVVKENQTVRGVKMSHEQFIMNHIKVFILVFGLLFLGNSVFGQTTTVRTYVNGEESPFPIVSMTETPHIVKVTITNNETGEEEEISTEEEPDCE